MPIISKVVGFDAATRTVTIQLPPGPGTPAVALGQWVHLDLDGVQGCGADSCPRATVPGQPEHHPEDTEADLADAERKSQEAAKLARRRPTPPTWLVC